MIGLDTNVLLRYLVKDDLAQHARARRLVEAATSSDVAWISTIVAAELVWALRRRYDCPREQIANVIARLLETAEIRFEHEAAVETALELYREGRVDFPDGLIVLTNRANGCSTTASFDRGLVKSGFAVEP